MASNNNTHPANQPEPEQGPSAQLVTVAYTSDHFAVVVPAVLRYLVPTLNLQQLVARGIITQAAADDIRNSAPHNSS